MHRLIQKQVNYNQIFGWQAGYGVFSFGSKQLNDAVNYVKRQKEHHAAGTIIHSLENIDDEHLFQQDKFSHKV